jgi:hypothetical protein
MRCLIHPILLILLIRPAHLITHRVPLTLPVLHTILLDRPKDLMDLQDIGSQAKSLVRSPNILTRSLDGIITARTSTN